MSYRAPGVEHIQKDPGHPCCSTPGFNFLSVVGRQGDDLAGVRRAENRLAKHCRQIILVGVLQKLPAGPTHLQDHGHDLPASMDYTTGTGLSDLQVPKGSGRNTNCQCPSCISCQADLPSPSGR